MFTYIKLRNTLKTKCQSTWAIACIGLLVSGAKSKVSPTVIFITSVPPLIPYIIMKIAKPVSISRGLSSPHYITSFFVIENFNSIMKKMKFNEKIITSKMGCWNLQA